MADLTNRSRYRVTVRNRPDLTRLFPFSKRDAVKAYAAELRARRLKPTVGQLDEAWLVRIRTAGQRPTCVTLPSREEAVAFLDEADEARRRGTLRGYAAARKVTVADLITRYLLEEAPRHKSHRILVYGLEGWLADSGPKGVAALERYRALALARGLPVPPRKFRMRKENGELTWIHKTFCDVTTVDIERFITDRLAVVAPATVDREIDRLKSLFGVAIRIWDYTVAKNPMDAVRRPKYFNERDRRIAPAEEHRLLDALARLDRERSVNAALREVVQAESAGQRYTSDSARKRTLAAIRGARRDAVEASAKVIPYLQTFYHFQVLTAARRSETMSLTWDRVDLAAGTAYLPETKNGRPRKLALRSSLVGLLKRLPRSSERVIPLGIDYLVGAWERACAAAQVADLHIHDLRHEALSRLAESGAFTLPELQAFSGHEDLRMLMRYSHLCASRLAKKLDATFGNSPIGDVVAGSRDGSAQPPSTHAPPSNVIPFARPTPLVRRPA